MRRAARVAVLGVMASGLLSLTAIAGASPAVSPTLSPPEGQSAVTSGQTLRFGGLADPNATLVSAELRFRDAAGDPVREPLDASDQLRLEGGGITGTYTLPSLCFDQAPNCLERINDGTVILAVTVEGEPTATSPEPGVRIDMVAPYILKASLGPTTKTVEVQFSEPVRLLTGEDSFLDWTIGGSCQKGRPVVGVSGQGDTRTLTLLLDEDEDATPLVQYCPLPDRPSYRDGANRSVTVPSRILTAVDRVAPAVPSIGEIAGKAGKVVTASDPSPTVRLNGLRPGHYGQVYLETSPPGSEDGFQRSQDTLLGEAQADASGSALVQVLLDLAPDGEHILYGVARDRASCSAGGSDVCPNYSGGDRGTYILDTIAPIALYAATDGPEVTVRFSEPVSGNDDPSQWTVNGIPPSGVSGGGEERILSVSTDAPAGAVVTWTAPSSDAYADDAGNPVASFNDLIADDFIPPVITVADPVTTVWTTADGYQITGSVSKPGSIVEAFDGERSVARQQLGPDQTNFALDVDLNADTTHNFILRATHMVGEREIVNRQDTFLPPIIQDSTAPTVNVTAPTKDDVLTDRRAFAITWEATDANFGDGPITISITTDGQHWDQFATSGNSGEYSWTPPANTNTEQAQIRVAVTDRVGFAAEDESEVFAIDSDVPEFEAVSVDNRHVEVQFTEAVSGTVANDEWQINNLPVGCASWTGLGSCGVNVATKINKIILETLPAQELGKNELPKITYEPLAIPDRAELHDRAGNPILNREVDAQDGIAPDPPVIEQIDGQSADGTVTSENKTPQVVVGSMDRDDIAMVFVDRNSDEKLTDADVPPVGTSGRASASGVSENTVNGDSEVVVNTDLSSLAPGEYMLFAQARDQAGNLSNPDAADSAVYRLEGEILLPTPVIETIAGQPAGEPVTANNPQPDVKVGNIAEGHTAAVYAESDGQPGFTAGDRLLGEQPAGPDGAVVQTADLGADATYTLYAAARQGSRRSAGADQATYILDTANPAFTAAVTDEKHVLVSFGEAVAGLAAEAEWQIDGAPSNATAPAGMASGLTTMTLETLPSQTIAATAAPRITYSPAGSPAANPAPAEFRDVAGNHIEVKTVTAAAKGTQPVPVPPGQVPPGTQPPPSQGGQPTPGTGGAPCDILGTAGNDILLGTEGADVICGSAGDDVIRAGAGADTIIGQEGNDVLRGGAGNDELSGGADKDSLFGEAGADALRGDGGTDRLSGGPGKDLLDGGPARDRCTGGPGANRERRC